MNKKNTLIFPIIFGLATFILDRITKSWAITALQEPTFITNWLSLGFTLNRGVSFGMFDSDNTLVFAGVSCFVFLLLLLVIVLAKQTLYENKSLLGHALILGGGLSNLFDRFLYHGVVDFIAVSIGSYHWPVFNIADAAIDIGVFVLLAQNLL